MLTQPNGIGVSAFLHLVALQFVKNTGHTGFKTHNTLFMEVV